MSFVRIVKFDIINIFKTPMLVIVNTLLPLVLFAGLGIAMNKTFIGGKMTSYDFYSVAVIIMSAMMIVMTASNVFLEEKVKRGNTRVIYAPIAKSSIYLSKIISTAIFSSLLFDIILLIEQYLFKCNLGGYNIIFVMILIDSLALFGSSLGIAGCCLLKDEEKTNNVMTICASVCLFFSGIFIPLGHGGKVMQILSSLSPVRYVVESCFQIIYDNNFALFFKTICLMVILSFFCAVVCRFTFKGEEYVR